MSWNFFDRFDWHKRAKAVGYSDIAVQICGVAIYATILCTKSEDLYKTLKENNFQLNSSDCIHFWSQEFKNETSCIVWSELKGLSNGVCGMLIHLVELYVAFTLLKGAETRNSLKCDKWIKQNTVLATLETILVTGGLALNEINILSLSYSIPSILFKLGSLKTIRSYVIMVRSPLTFLAQQDGILEQNDDTTEDMNPLLT